MGITKAAVVLTHIDGIVRDAVVHTYHFSHPLPVLLGPNAVLLRDVLNRFYGLAHLPGLFAIGRLISGQMSRAVIPRLSLFDAIRGGSPYALLGMLLLPAPITSSILPDQVCAVLACHAALLGLLERGPLASIPTDEEGIDEGAPATHRGRTRPKGSHRGRLYVGPMCHLRVLLPVVPRGVLSSLQGSASFLRRSALLAARAIVWSVFSKALGTASPIVGGWVENKWAIQRRRGVKATRRALWT